MPSVSGISITPVKSMRLHHPDRVRLEPFGVLENRRFYIAEPTGRLFNNRRFGPLQRVRAEWDPDADRLSLHFPDGTIVEGDSSVPGKEIRTDFFGRAASGHVVAGPFSRAISEYVGERVVLARTLRPGEASDSAPVSL
ncbi:MAG TPA: MOSC N-terminal beta barrel domain-containing protein, partial [Actinomycetota bacterium]